LFEPSSTSMRISRKEIIGGMGSWSKDYFQNMWQSYFKAHMVPYGDNDNKENPHLQEGTIILENILEIKSTYKDFLQMS